LNENFSSHARRQCHFRHHTKQTTQYPDQPSVHRHPVDNRKLLNHQPMKYLNSAVLALILCLGGCAATSLKHTAKAPDYSGGPVQKIAVLAVDERGFYRRVVEHHFAHQLQQHGQSVLMTYELLELPAINADKDAAAKTLIERGADAVLIVRLAGATTTASQTQATPSRFVPTLSGSDYNHWYGCYSTAFMDMGVVWNDTQMRVNIESGLFDLATGQRIWTGISETMVREQTDRVEEIAKVAKKVLAAMRKDGVVR
jgi:hypothetical protein